ncbi:eukaryotic translation initiation factor 2D-like, partial [Hyposmocoma kahamanoa]|uniref:eukaryotic translation initiation factor 2D-like n=1 Tax=Hyposmocoma kahamanoa TaxID=1477025 RepID=UPI000E6D98D7
MFAKPYKLKSINTLKNCDKKQLVKRMQDEFPPADEEKVKELVPAKSNAICMKLVLHNAETVSVFAVNSVPIIIDTPAGLIPTVCALWKLHDLLPVVTLYSPVLPKIQRGAPLYLPGVVIPQCGVGFPMFKSGTLIMCNTQDNTAAAVVGRTLMSSGDMLLKAGGVCLETINVIGDLLCKELKFNKIERPQLGNAIYTRTISSESTNVLAEEISTLHIRSSSPSLDEEWPRLEGRLPPLAPPPSAAPLRPPASLTPSPPDKADVAEVDEDVTVNAGTESDVPVDMDGLLRWCLLAFIKFESKSVELPLKTNLLYKNHMMPLCPPGRTLDVKKSSYRKMGKFLEAMQKEGLLEVRELDKGVAAVVGLAAAHPAARALAAP